MTPAHQAAKVRSVFQESIHGRGGEGVVTGAEPVALAAFLAGRHAQAFPSFGSERTAAPVAAICRIDDRENRVLDYVRVAAEQAADR